MLLRGIVKPFRGSTVVRSFGIAAKVLVGALIFVLLVEVGLRIVPALIPEHLLAEFHPETRSEIAQRRGLPTLDETVLIQRDDNGPELRIPKPFTKRNWPDREPGTVGATQVDGMGFCNPEGHSYDEPSIDLFSLGDSFIWCTAIDPKDTWTSKLTALTGYSTYSLAAIDTGLHEYVQILKQFGIQKSPRFVIMAVFEGNDLQDAVTYESFVAERYNRDSLSGLSAAPSNRLPALPYDPCGAFQVVRLSIIGRLSYASNVLLVLVQDACGTVSNRVTSATVSQDEAGNSTTDFGYRLDFPDLSIEFNQRNGGSDERIYAERLRSGSVVLGVFDEPLKSFVELAREHGFVPMVVYTPAPYTAYAANVVFDDPDLGGLMDWFSKQQRGYFKDQSSALGYLFLDLTPFLQSAAESTRGENDLLYFRSNRHLTQRGHTVVAGAISSVLGSIESSLQPDNILRP